MSQTPDAAPAAGPWRTGNKNPRNLYCRHPDGSEVHRGVMFAEADGPMVVSALNAAQSAAVDDSFVLYPPTGWLNRIDEVLRWHGAAAHDGSPLGEALGNLIRSWQGTDARNARTAPGPEHWGPRTNAAREHHATLAAVDYNALRELYVKAIHRGAGLAEELRQARAELAAKDQRIAVLQRCWDKARQANTAWLEDGGMVIPKDWRTLAAALHEADCGWNCSGHGLMQWMWDAKYKRMTEAVLASLRGTAGTKADPPATEQAEATGSYACTDECRDEHCVHPIACETRGQCPPQNPALRPGDGFDASRPYESCALDSSGHCSRPSHTHDSTAAEQDAPKRDADGWCTCVGHQELKRQSETESAE